MQITSDVKQVMMAEGISSEELHLMLHKAVINTTVEGFNRRFHNWLFKVNAASVLGMRAVKETEVGRDRNKGSMYEECEVCEGKGCKACGWIGEVKRFI